MAQKILIIEDDLEIRKNLVTILEMNGFETICAGNGNIGLQLALSHLPDLIISDIMMPVLNGLEMLAELRKHEEAINIPFLFLTARTEKHDIREGMNLGADDFITKPFDVDDLVNAVITRLSKSAEKKEHYQKKFDELRFSLSRSLPHEIRTPLSVILGYSEILQRSWKNLSEEDTADMLSNIHASAKRLHRVFEKYLFYAGLEIIGSNENEIQKLKEKISPSAKVIITDVRHRYALESARDKDITETITDVGVAMSEDYLNLIVEELLDNALKYSKKGSQVTITAIPEGKFFVMSIMNFGRGMTPKQISEIGAYVQFDRMKHEQQGLGLGLAIVKKIVLLHGGEFSIESEVEYFTTVTVKIPISDEEYEFNLKFD
jgi:signal transduction histidine kinase